MIIIMVNEYEMGPQSLLELEVAMRRLKIHYGYNIPALCSYAYDTIHVL